VPLPLGIAVGGVVAPPDAVAARAVGRRIGLPRQIVTVLEGESLFNDATALVLARLGIVAIGTSLSITEVVGQLVWTSIGGVGIGLIVAQVLTWVRRRVTDPISGTATSFLAPWLAYLPAEELHASGVLAVVVAGVILGHRAPVTQSATSRVTCGNVGCCDSSTGRHATAHHLLTSHPVMRSVEPGEGWRWCYVDDLLG